MTEQKQNKYQQGARKYQIIAGNGSAAGVDFFPIFVRFSVRRDKNLGFLFNCQPESTFFHDHTNERPLSTLSVFYTQHYYRFTTRSVIYINCTNSPREKKTNSQKQKLIGKKEIQVVRARDGDWTLCAYADEENFKKKKKKTSDRNKNRHWRCATRWAKCGRIQLCRFHGCLCDKYEKNAYVQSDGLAICVGTRHADSELCVRFVL